MSEADDNKKDVQAAKVRSETRRANRGALPHHLPRVDVTIAPEDTNCPVLPCATYAPGRGAVHALKLLETYRGIVQCDGYAAYKNIADDARAGDAISSPFAGHTCEEVL